MIDTPTLTHGSFTITRSFPHPVSEVYDAFSNKERRRRWFIEGEGFEIDSHTLDFREGGWEVSVFRYVAAERSEDRRPMTNSTVFLDIIPDERIVIAYTMRVESRRISSSLASFEFVADNKATTLHVAEYGVFDQGFGGIKSRETGVAWLLDSLERELGG